MKAIHQEIIERLCNKGFRTVIVGGYVRDSLLGKQNHDIDIATAASSSEIARTFPDKKVSVVHGTEFLVTYVEDVEVATFRKDRYKGGNSKNCEIIPAKTLEEDLLRRDLTINAIAMCHATGDIIDPHHGISDLKKNIIRFVGDPDKTITDDPDRILRACRFLAITEGQFDKKTLAALKRNSKLVQTHIAKERIRIEILKTLEKTKYASLFFEILHRIDALKYVFPSLASCCGHPHGTHHVEDVFEHSLLAGDNVSCKYPLLKLAAYLHDIGKPTAYASCGDGTFLEHESIGAELAKKELKELKFTNNEIQYVSNLIEFHMFSLSEAKKKGIRRLHKRLFDSGISVQDWYRLRIADSSANLKHPTSFSEISKQYKKLIDIGPESTAITVVDLAISGGQIIQLLGIPPGPAIGVLQKTLLNKVVDGELENEYNKLVQYLLQSN